MPLKNKGQNKTKRKVSLFHFLYVVEFGTGDLKDSYTVLFERNLGETSKSRGRQLFVDALKEILRICANRVKEEFRNHRIKANNIT